MKKLLAIAAIAVFAPSLAFAADVSGNWKIKTEAGGMDLVINCKLVQAGAALSGTCGPEGLPDAAPSTFTGGTVDGATAKWAYEVTFQDMKFNVAYTGTVNDATMTGTMNVLDMPSPFTATKQ